MAKINYRKNHIKKLSIAPYNNLNIDLIIDYNEIPEIDNFLVVNTFSNGRSLYSLKICQYLRNECYHLRSFTTNRWISSR